MGAWGAIIMSFFGAVFAAMTLALQFHLRGLVLGLPFLVFAVILTMAAIVLRRPGTGVAPTKRVERVILWSTVGEGIGLFVVTNLVTNLHHPELLLPCVALVVGLHFLPIAYAASFRPFYVLGSSLLIAAALGFAVKSPAGGVIAGFAAAGVLWTASVLAVLRDGQQKRRLQRT